DRGPRPRDQRGPAGLDPRGPGPPRGEGARGLAGRLGPGDVGPRAGVLPRDPGRAHRHRRAVREEGELHRDRQPPRRPARGQVPGRPAGGKGRGGAHQRRAGQRVAGLSRAGLHRHRHRAGDEGERGEVPEMIAALGLALLAAGPLLREQRFRVERPSEVVVRLTLGCERCDWAQPGREAAGLVLSVDGKYSQHLILCRGETPADYRVALGRLAAGPHRLQIRLDRGASAKHAGEVTVEPARYAIVPEDASDHAMLAFAPILHARPDTLERFSDLPLLMWCERETIPGGVRLRYSVIFSNEDGGTPI